MKRPSLKQSIPGFWRIVARFWPWIRTERPLIAGSLAALVASVLVRLAEPWPLKFILDRVIPTDRPEGLHSLPAVDGLSASALLTWAVLALVGLACLRALCDYQQKVGFAKVGNRVLRGVRDHVFDHVQKLSLSFHNRSRSGDLIVRVTRDVSLLRDVTSTAVLPLFANLLILAAMVVVMLLLHWQLALLAMVTVPLYWITTAKIGTKIRTAARKQREREGAMASVAAESIASIKAVQALSLENVFAGDFSRRNGASQKEDLVATRLSARLGRTVDVLLAIATALVLWYGATLVIQHALTPGDLVVFLAYLKRSFQPAKSFAKYTARLAKAVAAGERVLTLLDREPEVRDAPDAVTAPSFRGEIRFDAVRFSYEPGREVLQEIDLQIPAGQFAAVVGASGIGKSTVLSLIMRLYDPSAGRVLIDGHDIRDYTLASLRPQISCVLQDTVLFAGTVAENIAVGSETPDPKRVEACARLAAAHDFISMLPDGYDTPLGERGATLSHGQRQRLSIARAAMRDAPILILDEPTTGLDEENEREVIDALVRLARGRTTLLVTHDLDLAARADVVLFIEGGQLVERGSPETLLRTTGPFARLYQMRIARGRHHAS